jgi:putative ABC transport system permease protein
MQLNLAVRRLARAPLFVLTTLGTLAVGLGAFAVVYTVVDKVLIEPLPYDRPDDLYFVWRDYTWIPIERGWAGGTDVIGLAGAGGPIESAAGIDLGQATLSRSAGGEPEEVAMMISSANLFEILGVRPVLGRGFAPDEAGPGRTPVAVLSHGLWRRRFGGDRSVVGSEIRLNGTPYRVIGVAGPDFQFVRHSSAGPPEGADVYTTFDNDISGIDQGSFAVLVRARPHTPPSVVASAVGAVGATVDKQYFESKGLRLRAVGLKPDLVSGVRPALVVLGLAGVFLLLVLLVNLGALLLARAGQREREFAVSRALGARPLELVGATVAEGVLLGAVGGAAGALLAVWGSRALVALGPADLPRRESIGVDAGIALLVIGVGALLGLLAAAVPALWAVRTGLAPLLRNAAVRGGGGHGRMQRGMVVTQVALTLVLLSTGGLVARSFERLLRADPGFDPAGVLTVRVPASPDRYPDDAAANALHERLENEIRAVPGVRVVSAASALPLTAGADQRQPSFPGAPGNTGDPDHDEPMVDVVQVRPGYFEAMRIGVVGGRTFRGPPPQGVREAVIDRTLAAKFYPTGNPVGTTISFHGDSLTVVGVVEHARQYDVHQDGRPQIYLRNEDYTSGTLFFVIRTDRAPLGMFPGVHAAIQRVDPQLAVSKVRSMEEVMNESLRQQRVSAVLLGGFALAALLLAAMGLFGIVSSSVNRRRHELAVRMALGADQRRVLQLVVGDGARLVVFGLLVAVPGIYLAGKAIRGVLVGVSPLDPLTLGAVTIGLIVVSLVACYLPARRVLGIQPYRALREE